MRCRGSGRHARRCVANHFPLGAVNKMRILPPIGRIGVGNYSLRAEIDVRVELVALDHGVGAMCCLGRPSTM